MINMTVVSKKEEKIILNTLGKPTLSNCYLPYKDIIRKIENKEFQVLSYDGIVLLIQNKHEIHKMYYFVNEDKENSIGEDAYNNLRSKIKEYPRLVTDVVTRVPCTKFKIIERMGYMPYKQYLRYYIRAENVRIFESEEMAVYAEKADIDVIYQLLYSSFDVLTDDLPSKEEIDKFIAKQQIIKICRKGDVAGVLLFEKQGVKSYLRTLCVKSECKNVGIGYMLMTSYIKFVINGTKSFYLWVESTNKGAINLYEKLGYEPDGLIDYIFLYDERKGRDEL